MYPLQKFFVKFRLIVFQNSAMFIQNDNVHSKTQQLKNILLLDLVQNSMLPTKFLWNPTFILRLFF